MVITMHITFKTFGLKRNKWMVTDNTLTVFGKKRYKLEELDYCYLIAMPANVLSRGAIGVGHDNREFTLFFSSKQKSDAQLAVEYISKRINSVKSIFNGYEHLLISPRGDKWELYDDYVIMCNYNIASENGGLKKIYYNDVTAVQLVKPTKSSVGYMRLWYSGGSDFDGGVSDAFDDENSIIIDSRTLESAKNVYSFIERRKQN